MDGPFYMNPNQRRSKTPDLNGGLEAGNDDNMDLMVVVLEAVVETRFHGTKQCCARVCGGRICDGDGSSVTLAMEDVMVLVPG